MMEGGNWSGATTAFKRLVAQYPYGAYTEQALMEIAFAQYKMGDNDEAISSIDRFLRTYPTHRNTPYMYYLRGLVNSSRDTVFLQRVWKLDASRRDLATPNQAYADFATLIDRYPNTRYAQDARQRMVALRNMFARHEIEVALYYMRRQAWVAAAERAVKTKRPLILFAAAGGARMQEGILSLMQMPRTTVAVQMLKEAHLPYIVVLTHPTTGGVTASYAMLGDVQISEPNALICFAGPRVIEQTIREKLPDGFQRSEYLKDHGMVDMVVHRRDLPETLARLGRLLMKQPAVKEEAASARPVAEAV